MTPSNPSNSQPLIYRIMDALGVSHLVACINHTHEQSEVDGLPAALAGKLAKLTSFTTGNFVKVKSDGTLEDSGKSASDFAEANHTHTTIKSGSSTGNQTMIECYTSDEENQIEISIQKEVDGAVHGDEARITFNNIQNLKRALQTPDSTPTANSDKLVKSGGVKAALEGKANLVDVEYTEFSKSDPTETIDLDAEFDDGHEISHFILINGMGEQIKLSDFFQTQYWELVENGQTLSADSTAIVKIVHYNNGSTHKFFMIVEEIYEA